MQLLYQCDERLDYEMDFLDALRQCGADNFTCDEKTESELEALREDLLRLDDDLHRICQLNPDKQQRYQEQYENTLETLRGKIERLRIPLVRKVA